jgi:hypothetical protein
MGIHKEVRKMFGSSILNYLISARTAQGYEHWKSSTEEERLDIISRWHEHKSELQSTRQKVLEEGPEGQGTGHLSPRGFLQTRHLSFEERKKLHEERQLKRKADKNKVYGERGSRCPFCHKNSPHKHQEEISADLTPTSSAPIDHADFEEAIRASVAATSRGNPEEDLMIERAIRASIRELQRSDGPEPALSEQEALDRAIQASVAEAAGVRGRSSAEGDASPHDAEYHALLEKSIQDSLSLQTSRAAERPQADIDTDDDEDVKRAIEASKAAHTEQASKAKTEEEIVLEYVKKQSLMEEEHRKAHLERQKTAPDATADDGELKRALEESLKTHSAT